VTPDVATSAALLERRLAVHVARMDARVDQLLFRHAAPNDDEVTEIDVLCAAIAEVGELLRETRQRV
jgi:hypothetical protein